MNKGKNKKVLLGACLGVLLVALGVFVYLSREDLFLKGQGQDRNEPHVQKEGSYNPFDPAFMSPAGSYYPSVVFLVTEEKSQKKVLDAIEESFGAKGKLIAKDITYLNYKDRNDTIIKGDLYQVNRSSGGKVYGHSDEMSDRLGKNTRVYWSTIRDRGSLPFDPLHLTSGSSQNVFIFDENGKEMSLIIEPKSSPFSTLNSERIVHSDTPIPSFVENILVGEDRFVTSLYLNLRKGQLVYTYSLPDGEDVDYDTRHIEVYSQSDDSWELVYEDSVENLTLNPSLYGSTDSLASSSRMITALSPDKSKLVVSLGVYESNRDREIGRPLDFLIDLESLEVIHYEKLYEDIFPLRWLGNDRVVYKDRQDRSIPVSPFEFFLDIDDLRTGKGAFVKNDIPLNLLPVGGDNVAHGLNISTLTPSLQIIAAHDTAQLIRVGDVTYHNDRLVVMDADTGSTKEVYRATDYSVTLHGMISEDLFLFDETKLGPSEYPGANTSFKVYSVAEEKVSNVTPDEAVSIMYESWIEQEKSVAIHTLYLGPVLRESNGIVARGEPVEGLVLIDGLRIETLEVDGELVSSFEGGSPSSVPNRILGGLTPLQETISHVRHRDRIGEALNKKCSKTQGDDYPFCF